MRISDWSSDVCSSDLCSSRLAGGSDPRVMSPRHWSLGQIVDALDLRLRGDSSRVVRGVATLAKAGPDQIAFLANPRYRRALGTTRAAAVVLHAEHADACPVDSDRKSTRLNSSH